MSFPTPARGVTGEATGSIARLVGALEILPHDPHPRQIDVTEHLVVDVTSLVLFGACDAHALHDHGLERAVPRAGGRAADRADRLHALDHLAEHRVLPV